MKDSLNSSHLFSNEIHWIDILITVILIPPLTYLWYYFIKRIRYRRILGEYRGGKSTVIVKFSLFSLGFFIIDGVEAGGQRWAGKYKMNADELSMEGKFIWNIGKNIDKPDVGNHIIYFSEDRTTVDVIVQNLTDPTQPDQVKTWVKS